MIADVASRWWSRFLPGHRARTRPRGLLISGTVWTGAGADPADGAAPGRVVVDVDGRLARLLPPAAGGDDVRSLPADLRLVRAVWIAPAPVDAHVELAPGDDPAVAHAGGLAALRDVAGAVSVAAPDVGVPAWPQLRVVLDEAGRRRHAQQLRRAGVRAVSVDLVDDPRALAAIVASAHDAGLAVLAAGPTVALVGRALDAGVDELLGVPRERLPETTVERLAAAGVAVTSTLQRYYALGAGPVAARNAADLVRAGVTLRYGSGRGGSTPGPAGVDARELDRLAGTGLGRAGALRAATVDAAAAPGLDVAPTRGRLVLGEPADLVALGADPLVEPLAWHAPVLVLVGGTLHHPAGADTGRR